MTTCFYFKLAAAAYRVHNEFQNEVAEDAMPVLSFRRMGITTCFFILCIYWFAKFFHVQVNHHAPRLIYLAYYNYYYI